MMQFVSFSCDGGVFGEPRTNAKWEFVCLECNHSQCYRNEDFVDDWYPQDKQKARYNALPMITTELAQMANTRTPGAATCPHCNSK